jgi:hypothetical protein
VDVDHELHMHLVQVTKKLQLLAVASVGEHVVEL